MKINTEYFKLLMKAIQWRNACRENYSCYFKKGKRKKKKQYIKELDLLEHARAMLKTVEYFPYYDYQLGYLPEYGQLMESLNEKYRS